MPNIKSNLNTAADAAASNEPLNTKDLNWHQTKRMNDATVYGDMHSLEARKVLETEFTAGFSERAPKVSGDKWFQLVGPFHQALDLLTKHPVSGKKEGSALFFNETELTGRERELGRQRLPLAYRGKSYAKSVTAFVIDVDGTDKIDRVRDKLIELGIFAVLYTTFSHARKSTDGGDYFRVIIPLERSFLVEENGGNVSQASRQWLSLYIGFAERLGIEELDLSAAKFVQMMYLPRRCAVDAPYKHYLVAGRALTFDDMPCADIPKIKGAVSVQRARQRADKETHREVILKDGFNTKDFLDDHGDIFAIDLFLEMLGWDIINENAGAGMTVMCPNHNEHSEPDDGSESGCWCCPSDGENHVLIMCHHNHCRDLCTWHFLKLLEERIDDGDAVLADEFSSLSEMICDSMFFPEIDGKSVTVHASEYGAVVEVLVERLSTPKKVETAFAKVTENLNSGEDDYVALFAGVDLAGGKRGASNRLFELLKSEGQYKTNDLARLKKLGSALAKEKGAEFAARRAQQTSQKLDAAADGETGLAHPSWDIADPLGDTMEEALATLAKRWRVVSIGGKVRFLNVPDPSQLSAQKVAIETMSKADFILYHEDRKVFEGKELINPATPYVERALRLSGIEFAPPPVHVLSSTYNLYRGREITPNEGSCEHIKHFIRHTVCKDRENLFRFVWLYLAHLVQRPGEKPQTAIVLRGLGGCGKSTFGLVLERLAAPYSLTISEEEHITGRFAGAHLATSLVAICTEALFAGDPKVNGKIKNLVTSDTILVEPKGLPVVQMRSYVRLYFDSNNERVVPIDGNGSERRYLVMEVNDDHKNDRKYFDPIYEELYGQGSDALAHELANYDPAEDGLRWEDIRIAPDTPERRRMRYHSMRPVERAIIRLVEDGTVTMKTESGQAFRYEFEDGKPIRLPRAELRDFLGSHMNRHEAKDGDIEHLMNDIFGERVQSVEGVGHVTVRKLRGNVECLEYMRAVASGDDWTGTTRKSVYCFEFPPIEVLRSVIAEKYPRV
jgi:hypothetical protein